MWLAILLSALLFSAAFIIPACAWCVLLFALPLWWWLYAADQGHGLRRGVAAGAWWGVVVWGAHFSWIVVMMLRHTQASWLLCWLTYAAVVAYGTATAVGWFVVMVGLQRLLLRVVTTGVAATVSLVGSAVAYWLFLEHLFLRFLFMGDGYPLLSPFIPLARYHWFRWLVGCVGCLLHGPVSGPVGVRAFVEPLPAIVYCAPVTNRVLHVDAPWRTNASQVGYKLYERLCDCPLQASAGTTLVVSPESTFCFPLNHHQDMVTLWSSVLPPRAHCLMGSVWQDGRHVCQALFWLHAGLINKIYVKKYLAPFVERVPPAWESVGPLKEAFLGKCVEFSSSANTPASCDAFYITPRLCVVPRICSEFFLHDQSADFRYVPYVNKYGFDCTCG